MWARATSVLLFLLGGNTNAQSAEESSPSAQDSLCYRAALVDLACSKLPEHLAQRPNCLEARAAQQKCLEQALPEASAGRNGPSSASGAAPLALPAAIAPPESSPERPIPQGPGWAISPEGSATGAHADETKGRPKISPTANSSNVDRPAVDDEPVAAIRTGTSAKSDQEPALGSGGTVNETKTPLDSIPLVIAVIHATSNMKDSPNTFEVRCRGQRTELALSTDGAWVAPPGDTIQVDYQINDWPTVRQPWILSADRRTVTYNDDPVKLLRSMPNRATLRVTVADSANVRHEATFRLTQLAMIKRKMATACGWPRATTRRVHVPEARVAP
jgi:hypothetical protein